MGPRYLKVIVRESEEGWRFFIVDGNNKITLTSEPYVARPNALRAAKRFLQAIEFAKVEDDIVSL